MSGPCNPPDRTVTLSVQDAAGNVSAPQSVSLLWQTFQHDESGIGSSDACEPCVSGITLDEMPAVVCGSKRNGTYFDFVGPTFGPVPVLGGFVRWLYKRFVG